MNKVVYIGVDRNARGGIASVLKEYEKLFPEARFIATSTSGNSLSKMLVFIKSLIQIFFIALFSSGSVFHIHGASYTSFKRKFIIWQLIKLFNRKVVYHVHGGEFHLFYQKATPDIQSKVCELIEGADCVICLSEQWKAYFLENFKPKRIEIVRNIVSKSSVQASEKTGLMTFLFLGFITEGKGVWLLLEAAKILKSQGKEFQLMIGGNGESDLLQSLIENYNLSNEVKYVGWVSGEAKVKLLQQSSVFVLPSYNEGVPISILEAMSHDLPIIATRVGGIPDVVDKKSGLLIEPGNVKKLQEAMLFAIENPEKMKNLGKDNNLRISNHYPETVKQQLLKIYSEVLQK